MDEALAGAAASLSPQSSAQLGGRGAAASPGPGGQRLGWAVLGGLNGRLEAVVPRPCIHPVPRRERPGWPSLARIPALQKSIQGLLLAHARCCTPSCATGARRSSLDEKEKELKGRKAAQWDRKQEVRAGRGARLRVAGWVCLWGMLKYSVHFVASAPWESACLPCCGPCPQRTRVMPMIVQNTLALLQMIGGLIPCPGAFSAKHKGLTMQTS